MARPRSLSDGQIRVVRKLRENGVPAKRIAKRFKVSHMTVYRYTWPRARQRAYAKRRALAERRRYAASKRSRSRRRR